MFEKILKLLDKYGLTIFTTLLGVAITSIVAIILENGLEGLSFSEVVFFLLILITCFAVLSINHETRKAIIENNKVIDEKVNETQTELQNFVTHLNQCTFMEDPLTRLETMALQIKSAKKSVLLLSFLSRYSDNDSPTDEESINPIEKKLRHLHKEYLFAIEEVAEKNKNNKRFEILRIVVPPANAMESELNYKEWKKSVISHPIYGPHFSYIEDFHKNSLMILKFDQQPPEGVSILIVDDHFLLIQQKVASSIERLNEKLDGGLAFSNHSQNPIDDFKRCFEEAKRKSDLISKKEMVQAKKSNIPSGVFDKDI